MLKSLSSNSEGLYGYGYSNHFAVSFNIFHCDLNFVPVIFMRGGIILVEYEGDLGLNVIVWFERCLRHAVMQALSTQLKWQATSLEGQKC